MTARPEPVPQHLCLVLPSTGEFDSRTYRIATTCLARGHDVTVLARWKDGLPREETHPAGYRIVRVPASSIDGLPFPGARAALGRLVRRIRPRGETIPRAGGTAGPPIARPAPARRASLPRRALAGAIRRGAIPLTIRSHTRNALAAGPPAALYHGMAYMGIPVALALGRRHGAPVVYDARDIYLEARNLARMGRLARWYVGRLERGWARASNRVITVNRAYAEVMATRFHAALPLVVMNCSYRYAPPSPPPRRFHERLGLPPATPVVLYHGGLFRERGIEQLLEAIALVPDAALVLMGYGAFEAELRELIRTSPDRDRIHLLPAVPPQDLHDWVASADVVAMPIQPSTLNHRLTTPNKLFEAMAAGVPVVASDLPGMAGIVKEVGFGRLCDPTDPTAIGTAIEGILRVAPAERETLRRLARNAADTTYNWETQAAILLAEYGRITGKPW